MPPAKKNIPPESAPGNSLPSGIARVGRQPILDRKRRTYGYELLYRAGGVIGAGVDGNQATARTMLNAFVDLGLTQLTGDRRVFINLTRAFFTEMDPLPLDKRRLVLEILEDIDLDDEMTQGVKRMRRAGYKLALDDYRFEPRWDPLLPYASIIKVDIMDLDLARYSGEIQTLKDRGIKMLAEKVETQDEFKLARDLGFDLFQGYFFARPEIVSGRSLDSNALLLVKLLGRINDPRCSIEELAQMISLDPKLSFKILRVINSAAMGLPRQVGSIREAVVYLGLVELRAWTSLLAMSGLNDQTEEILTTSLIRAELCQRLCLKRGIGEPESAYTVGLLSVLDSLLQQSMADLVEGLGLSEDMRTALVSHSGPYGEVLSCALALEKGEWQDPSTKQLPEDQLSSMFIDAVAAAEARHQGLS